MTTTPLFVLEGSDKPVMCSLLNVTHLYTADTYRSNRVTSTGSNVVISWLSISKCQNWIMRQTRRLHYTTSKQVQHYTLCPDRLDLGYGSHDHSQQASETGTIGWTGTANTQTTRQEGCSSTTFLLKLLDHAILPSPEIFSFFFWIPWNLRPCPDPCSGTLS